MKRKPKNEGRLEPGRKKTDPPREDDMTEKEVQALLYKHDQKLMDIFNKRLGDD